MVCRTAVHGGWRGFLSLRDPAALSGRPGHPERCCASKRRLFVPARRDRVHLWLLFARRVALTALVVVLASSLFAFFNLQFEIPSRLTPPAPPYEGGEKVAALSGGPTYEGGEKSAKPNEPSAHRGTHVARSPGQALSPEESLALIRTRPELKVEIVAAEPLVASPVAIDFGPDGKLWVAEMADYPMGLDGNYQPGGRVRVLESTHEDGRFDKATVFLEGIPFPTGVTVWRKGVLVCAAPDILFAEDTDGDGRADNVRKLFSGFGTHNYQARVNSLEYGLDGWVYGSCGIFGGTISNDAGKPAVALGDRDFRIKPDEGIIEPASGRTQQGRVRDDWGNWFGCDNTNLCRHYPLPDEYIRRNPHFAPEVLSVNVPEGPDPERLFPLAANLQLFKLSGPAGRTTAACGLGIYRDDLLGEEFRGNAFVCEPVNLLVHRMQLVPKGFSFIGKRAEGETESEFLASTDPWFRPVQARTGPDGALWIVDMYRQVIEHPRWIPPEDLAKLDVRAGFDKGRIYRVKPATRELRKWARLDGLDSTELVAALDSPNGWQRDMAGELLVARRYVRGNGNSFAFDSVTANAINQLATDSPRPETRVSALCVSGRFSAQVPQPALRAALDDKDPAVRRHAVRLAEKQLNRNIQLDSVLPSRINDSDAQVRLQLALTLGELRTPRPDAPSPAGHALAALLLSNADDAILAGGVFSSLRSDNVSDVVREVVAGPEARRVPDRVLERLFQVAAALGDRPARTAIITNLCQPRGADVEDWQLLALAGIYEALERRDKTPEDDLDEEHLASLDRVVNAARLANLPASANETRRMAAIKLLSHIPRQRPRLLKDLPALLTPESSPALQAAAASAFGRIADESSIGILTKNWRSYSPALKSQVIDILLSREQWHALLLNEIPATDIDATRRQRLLTSHNADLRKLAEERFAGAPASDRQKVLEEYRDVAALAGDRTRGQQVFAKACSVCHQLGEKGYAVGPDLAAVANKTPQYLLQEILDPNRNVDSRYVAYTALTNEGRSFSGLLASETAGSITLKGQEGKQQVILRSDLEELQSSSMSLMPIGLEKDLSKQDLADLISYVARVSPALEAADPPPAEKANADDDPAAIARQILDDARPAKEREELARKNVDRAADLVAAMTADLKPDPKEEYRRIPWIWRAAVAAGRKNDTAVLQRLLEASLPQAGDPLRDWQAVVIGGGIINGVSEQGVWPLERMDELLKDRPELKTRWRQTLDRAAAMADNEKTLTGTRYDALRVIALDGWKVRGAQLTKYLARDVNEELQMGAVSATADIDAPEAAAALVANFGNLTASNRKLAIDGLLRTEPRTVALIEALEAGRIKPGDLKDQEREALRKLKNETLRARAEKVLTQE